MNIQTIVALFASITYLLIGSFVYFRNSSRPLNRHFSLMLLCVSIWQIQIAGIRGAPNVEFADMWGSLFRIGLLFIPPTFLHFSIVFTSPKGIQQRERPFLFSFYATSFLLTILSLIDYVIGTEYFTKEVKKYSWGYSIQGGPLYPIFIAEFKKRSTLNNKQS